MFPTQVFARRCVMTQLRRSFTTSSLQKNQLSSQSQPQFRLSLPQFQYKTFQPQLPLTRKFPQGEQRRFLSNEAAPAAVIENLTPQQEGFVSRALRTKATAKYKNIPLAPRKLEYLCRFIRGMNVREAVIQLRLSSKRKTYFLRRGIRTLTNTAMNTYNMNKDRLVVSGVSVTRGSFQRRVEYRARGRANLRMKRKSHLFITLTEQPFHKGEIRIGRYGRTIDTWTRFDKLAEAWKLKKAEEM